MTLSSLNGPKKRVILYLRLSVSRDESTSIERQEEDMREDAARNHPDWEITCVIVDDGKSGRKVRENAQRALRMLANREADVLFVWKFDRWSRQGLSAVAELKEVLDTTPGAEAWFLKDGINSPQGSSFAIILTILAEQAKTEAETTRMRVINSNEFLSKAGRWRGGTPPYGYSPVANPDGPGFILAPDERSAIVEELAQSVLYGTRVEQLCTMLNERGTPSPNGGLWFSTSMTKVLRNPALRGIAIHQKRMVTDKSTGLPLRPYKPILDDDTWFQVQDRLFHNGYFRQGNGDRSMHLLHGIAKCDECNGNLSRRTPVSISCRTKDSRAKCPGVAVTRERLEEYVTEQFLAFAGDSPVMDEHVEEPKTAEIRGLLEALAEIGKQFSELDPDDEETFDRLRENQRALKRQVKALENRPVAHELVMRPTGETYGQEWEKSDVEERRALLSTVIKEVRVKKGARGRKGLDESRVRIVWAIEEMNAA